MMSENVGTMPTAELEITPNDFSAVKVLVETLDCGWWLKDYYHKKLAEAYRLGRTSVNL